MKIIILIIIVVIVFSSLGLWIVANGNTLSEEKNMNYGISMMTDNINYAVGEPIMMTLKIFNYTGEDIVFHFNTSQRFDFIIEDEEGKKVWHWSEGRMFAQMLGEEILGPNNPEIIYTAEYKDKLRPGYYKVTGILVAQDRPISGNIIIMVK
ncbi:MAG: BsuPI-related putative proteinase inhibitor [Candidatus Bathyarchaeota archaeon]|nr:BsuPI-related putative proteinase inhibitor [Candidatus Bathyarchaeota archaeon]